MTIKELKIKLIKKMKNTHYEDEASSYIYLVMEHVLNMPKEQLVAFDDKKLLNSQEERIIKDIDDVINDKPVAYITGNKEFMGYEFTVDENVLVPRPETELLVESAILTIKRLAGNLDELHILDLCTGSGCISLGILLRLREIAPEIYGKVQILATDASIDAIKTAIENREQYNIPISRLSIIESDMFANIPIQKFDIIISNPPYIRTADIPTLDLNVQNEPHMALDGGEDGLKFYRIIAQKTDDYLATDGYLLMEIGYDQAEDVKGILKQSGFDNVLVQKDMSDNDRVVITKKVVM